MSTPQDLKAFGLPTTRAPISNTMVWFVRGCFAVIILGTAYGLTADEPERKVVTITLPVSTYVQAIEAARMEAALEAIDAVEPEPCPTPGWRNLFREPARKPAPPTM